MSIAICDIQGISGTLHTTRGDLDMGQPRRLQVRGSAMDLYFEAPAARPHGETTGFSLTVGPDTVRREMEGTTLPRHGTFTVIQRIYLDVLTGQ